MLHHPHASGYPPQFASGPRGPQGGSGGSGAWWSNRTWSSWPTQWSTRRSFAKKPTKMAGWAMINSGGLESYGKHPFHSYWCQDIMSSNVKYIKWCILLYFGSMIKTHQPSRAKKKTRGRDRGQGVGTHLASLFWYSSPRQVWSWSWVHCAKRNKEPSV